MQCMLNSLHDTFLNFFGSLRDQMTRMTTTELNDFNFCARDTWEEGNPASWGSSPQYQVCNLLLLFCMFIEFLCDCSIDLKTSIFQPSSPRSRPYEAPTPGSGWNNSSTSSYNDAGTPRDNSSSYGNQTKIFLL